MLLINIITKKFKFVFPKKLFKIVKRQSFGRHDIIQSQCKKEDKASQEFLDPEIFARVYDFWLALRGIEYLHTQKYLYIWKVRFVVVDLEIGFFYVNLKKDV